MLFLAYEKMSVRMSEQKSKGSCSIITVAGTLKQQFLENITD